MFYEFSAEVLTTVFRVLFAVAYLLDLFDLNSNATES